MMWQCLCLAGALSWMVEGAEQEEARRERSWWSGGTIAGYPRLGGLGLRAVGFCGEPGQSPEQPFLIPG